MDKDTLFTVAGCFDQILDAEVFESGDGYDIKTAEDEFLGIYFNGEKFQVGEDFTELYDSAADALFAAFVILGGSPEDFPNF